MVEWPLEMIIPTHGITHIQVALLGKASGMKPRLRLLRQLCLSLERSCKAPRELPEWFQGLPSHPGSWGLWEKTASVAWTGVEDWGGLGRPPAWLLAGLPSKKLQKQLSYSHRPNLVGFREHILPGLLDVSQTRLRSAEKTATQLVMLTKVSKAGHICNQALPMTGLRHWVLEDSPLFTWKLLWVIYICDQDGKFYLMSLQVICSNF